ncbi:hypothetical protein SAMD00019534_016770 [Acytostelium subglobosum LB1]|uniref:hypothetical protein n=1 Tax=Acytostelium subglobosum LB1 TaxID=1410327 RepID=UPI00064493F1|nr:hypothetical protein SAMD00019534_016770 [Acytostelium subglobosum LB1]GAM18502.1 hypothetical protein SAMD00019534_016770 [Acytostelium subglobosum LB1]|eukprot:XP_012757722.1 hypothetical protein SAMD00019534_016770 [Acytostelium subglobosum LB1]
MNATTTNENTFITVFVPVQVPITLAKKLNATCNADNFIVLDTPLRVNNNHELNELVASMSAFATEGQMCPTVANTANSLVTSVSTSTTTAHSTTHWTTTSLVTAEHFESSAHHTTETVANSTVRLECPESVFMEHQVQTPETSRTSSATSTSCVFDMSDEHAAAKACFAKGSSLLRGCSEHRFEGEGTEGTEGNLRVLHRLRSSSRSSSSRRSFDSVCFVRGSDIGFIIVPSPIRRVPVVPRPDVPTVSAAAVPSASAASDSLAVLPLPDCCDCLWQSDKHHFKSGSYIGLECCFYYQQQQQPSQQQQQLKQVDQRNYRRSLRRQRSNSTGSLLTTTSCRIHELVPWNDCKDSLTSKTRISTSQPATHTTEQADTISAFCQTNTASVDTAEDDQCFFDWFADFSMLEESTDKADAVVTKRQPMITYRTLEQFMHSLETCQDDDMEECSAPCTKTHTYNRPSAAPRLAIKSTWYVYGNALNTEYFNNCMFDTHCGDIIVDHFEPLVNQPDLFLLSNGGRRILETPNAGGNSVWSEVLSYEVLHQVFGAQLKSTETEIQYLPGSKITDYSVTFDGHHIGVSVVRIINFFDLMGKKYKAVFTPEYARQLLYKKLFGVLASSEAVIDKWEKQILYIWTTSSTAADIIVQEYWKIPKRLRSNTLVYVTHATNSEWLF